MILKTLHRIAIITTATVLPGMVIERCMATCLHQVYEKSVGSFFGYTFCIVQEILVICIVIYGKLYFPNITETYEIISNCQREYIMFEFTILITYAIAISAVISIISFLILLHVNKYLYGKAITNFANGYLTRKFQLLENIKISRLLYPCIGIYFFGLILSCGLLIIATKMPYETMTKENIFIVSNCFGQSVDIVLALITTCFCLQAMNKFKKVINNVRNTREGRGAKVAPLYGKNSKGGILLTNFEHERNLYFAELNKQWEKK
uniref:G_PROTEIN_RECEP_F1_2 domain-containing protein n=1 Tax=Parastrongyloides trichosuri TaxID=131310 RepID=A0A0N4Z0P9_PARTI